jgi:hypothetical protein
MDLVLLLQAEDRIRLEADLLGSFDLVRHHGQPGADAEQADAAGAYRSDELDAVLTLDVVDGHLRSRIGWGPVRRLTSQGGGVFSGEGFVVRVRTDGPEPQALIGTVRAGVQRFTRVR